MIGAGGVDGRAIELERIRAIAASIQNPVRSLLMSILTMELSLSVEDLAQRLGVSARTVRKHIALLINEELVALQREESRRGVVKRYYATRGPLKIDCREDSILTKPERRRLSIAVIRMIVRELARAGTGPELDRRSDRVLANVPGLVDERGWGELSKLHHEVLDRVEEVMANARMRVASGAEPIRVISQLVLLETSTFPRPQARSSGEK